MRKAVVAVIVGIAVWIAIVIVAGLIMRSSWPAYASVADAMTFTLPMLLAGFIPQHITLWEKFPVWYHLTFLLSLIPLTLLGGKLELR